MPTGYTAEIHDGKPITFPEFVMNCARAFGALALMRDDPADAVIPDEFKPRTDYHDEQLVKHRAELARLEVMTPEQIVNAHADVRAGELRERTKDAVKNRDMRARYRAMLAEVEAWEPPTPDHVGLKEFMVKQITESIDFDCREGTEFLWPRLSDDDPAVWYEAQIAEAKRGITYATEERAKEIERAEQRTSWVRALRDSLPVEAVA